jgi:hypothetical protein
MPTSGTATFATTRNQVINHAARLCGALRQGESLGAAKIATFEYTLNAMVKHWQANGVRVWTVAEGVLVPQANQTVYSLGSTSTDHAALDSDFFQTTLSADEASGQTVLSATSTADMAALDNIGIVVDDGTVHWSTIASKTATTVTINDALDDDAAAGAHVFTYTTKLVRPIFIPEDGVRLWNLDGESITPIMLSDRMGFRSLSQPNALGLISQALYDRQNTLGKFSIWQTPSVVTDLVKFTHWRPIEDFNAAGDAPDLPQEWILCLGFNLAKLMAVEYGLGEKRYAMVANEAQRLYDDVTGFGREGESVRFGVDMGC